MINRRDFAFGSLWSAIAGLFAKPKTEGDLPSIFDHSPEVKEAIKAMEKTTVQWMSDPGECIITGEFLSGGPNDPNRTLRERLANFQL